MKIFNSIIEIEKYLDGCRNGGNIIGFVPTMGALHQGHISLISKSKSECEITVSSIFVNPTQFNDLNDLVNYPRTPEKDYKLIEDAGCDIAFVPEIQEIYTPQELEYKKLLIEDKSWANGKEINFGLLDKVMEGLHRPGHFNGVAQVVSKLFNIVQPNKAYFGQKDFQQLAIIKSLVKQLDLPIEIVSCPIIREPNGLAMSSRNERLTKEEREKAAIISKTLFKVQQLKNEKSIGELKQIAESEIKKESAIHLEYFEIANMETLQALTSAEQAENAIACIALKLGAVRLIDNVVLL
jgi:pantoate--beta-alanine ligase